MEFHVTFKNRRDLSGQIYSQIRGAILAGYLRSGDPLPPSRELAHQLEVARNTVSVAYDRLAAEGFVSGKVGAGTFVNSDVPVERSSDSEPAVGPLRPRTVWDRVNEPPDISDVREFDFRAGVPDGRLFPYETWRRLLSRALRPSAMGSGGNSLPAGHDGLRAAIVRHIGLSRGVQASADDVIVTTGIQQALDLLARVLLEPGACVAMEDPGYPVARHLFVSLGARVVSVPVDAEGLVVEALLDDAQLVYVTPSHQFPLGVTMSLRRRMALLAWADRHGAAIVEDDYDSEYRFTGRPIEPLHSIDRTARVLYVGSFSKVMLPSLRLGFLIAPPSLHQALCKAKYVTDWHTSLPSQLALARFIDDGMLARHIRKMRAVYAVRHERVGRVLKDDFAEWLKVVPSVVGLNLTARTPGLSMADVVGIIDRAAEAGVALFPLSQYTADPKTKADHTGLVVGYGAIPTDRIDEGLHVLRERMP